MAAAVRVFGAVGAGAAALAGGSLLPADKVAGVFRSSSVVPDPILEAKSSLVASEHSSIKDAAASVAKAAVIPLAVAAVAHKAPVAVTSAPNQESSCAVKPITHQDSEMICERYMNLGTNGGKNSSFYQQQPPPKVQDDGRIKMRFKTKDDLKGFFDALAKTGIKFLVHDSAGKLLFKSEKNALVVAEPMPEKAVSAESGSSNVKLAAPEESASSNVPANNVESEAEKSSRSMP
ncbi:MAG: hypothetical protein P4L65_04465 [Legionella sp.]|nr:hypothetical protein [Legionella sp.]